MSNAPPVAGRRASRDRAMTAVLLLPSREASANDPIDTGDTVLRAMPMDREEQLEAIDQTHRYGNR
jgi:hypothetical protein